MLGGRVSSYQVMAPAEVARLIDTHSAPLVLYARQWSDAPEDVVQEAFIKLVRQSRQPEDTVAWLYRVVRNGALDDAKMARRRQRRESAAARRVPWFVEPEMDGLDAETAVAALERLAPEQREVIVAHHWGGLSFEQIAAVVGCSASTAFRRYTAGVEDLRNQLGVICPSRSSND
jgi:RNA polymerase sigma-70 factor (ECF subfamily)